MSPIIEKLSNLERIVSEHDVFVFDLCGVVHDGERLLDDTVGFIRHLHQIKKYIVFLSNSSKDSGGIKTFLLSIGMDIEDSYQVMSSGEFFRHQVKHDPSLSKEKKFFDLGNNFRNFKKLSMNFVDDISSDVDYVIISVVSKDLSELKMWQDQLEIAAANKIPALCINPDLTAPHGEGSVYTPGYFADMYEKIGGKVTYFGKPHYPIYEFTLSEYIKEKSIPKNRIIAIGDALRTDIKGANDFGIHSLLVLRKGLHKDMLNQDLSSINQVCDAYGAYPNYVIDDMTYTSTNTNVGYDN